MPSVARRAGAATRTRAGLPVGRARGATTYRYASVHERTEGLCAYRVDGKRSLSSGFQPRQEFSMNKPTDNKALQDEGNYDAARRYDKAAHDFAQSGQVEEAARAARPASPEEAAELLAAEQAGKSHTKGEDPAIATPALPIAPKVSTVPK